MYYTVELQWCNRNIIFTLSHLEAKKKTKLGNKLSSHYRFFRLKPSSACVHAKSLQLCTVRRTVAPRLLCPWDSPGKDTGVVAMPSSRDLPNLGTESESLTSPALAGRLFTTSATWEALKIVHCLKIKKKKIKLVFLIKKRKRLPWWSSGWDSKLPVQVAWVQFLVWEVRSHMPWSVAKKNFF